MLQFENYKKLQHLVKETFTLRFGVNPLLVKFHANLNIVKFRKCPYPPQGRLKEIPQKKGFQKKNIN